MVRYGYSIFDFLTCLVRKSGNVKQRHILPRMDKKCKTKTYFAAYGQNMGKIAAGNTIQPVTGVLCTPHEPNIKPSGRKER